MRPAVIGLLGGVSCLWLMVSAASGDCFTLPELRQTNEELLQASIRLIEIKPNELSLAQVRPDANTASALPNAPSINLYIPDQTGNVTIRRYSSDDGSFQQCFRRSLCSQQYYLIDDRPER